MMRYWALLLVLLALLFSWPVSATDTGDKTAKMIMTLPIPSGARYADEDSSDVVLICPAQEADTTGQCTQADMYRVYSAGIGDSIPRWTFEYTVGEVYNVYVNGVLNIDVSGRMWSGTVAHDNFIQTPDAFADGVVDSRVLGDSLTIARLYVPSSLEQSGTFTAADGEIETLNLAVTGDTQLGDALGDSVTVVGSLIQGSGQVQLSGDITAFGDLDVSGDVTIGDNDAIDDLDITARTTINADMVFGSAVGDTASFSGPVTLAEPLIMGPQWAIIDSFSAGVNYGEYIIPGLSEYMDDGYMVHVSVEPRQGYYNLWNVVGGVNWKQTLYGAPKGYAASTDTVYITYTAAIPGETYPFRAKIELLK